MPIAVTEQERSTREAVLAAVLNAIKADERIEMGAQAYSGSVSEFNYVFEGEDDLLHLSVERKDGGRICVEQAQDVLYFLLPTIPWGVVWLKPGTYSHHFYVGHDELLKL